MTLFTYESYNTISRARQRGQSAVFGEFANSLKGSQASLSPLSSRPCEPFDRYKEFGTVNAIDCRNENKLGTRG